MEEQEKESVVSKVNSWYKELPDKKKYVEFVTAILSVPVLVTVIISNVNNLKNKDAEVAATPTPSQIVQYIPAGRPDTDDEEVEAVPSPTPSGQPTPSTGECKKEVGPVDISYPSEGATISENPVTVVVDYHPGEYCAVVWSYRINGGTWSPFDDKSIALYGMPAGEKRLELKVKSIASGQEVFITRNFVYEPEDNAQVQSATSSAEPSQ